MSTSPIPTAHDMASAAPKQRDEGSVLPMILALMVVGSLGVVALLTFATTLFINRPPIEVRDQTFWSAKSAMSMAMTLQREHGPDGCYPGPYAFTLNGFTADVTCTPTGNYFGTGRGRFALITTSNDFEAEQLAGSGTGAAVKPIVGDVLLNGGSFSAAGADIGVQASTTGVLADVLTSNYTSAATPTARYNDPTVAPTVPPAPVATDCANPAIAPTMAFPGPGTAWTPTCQAQPWWELAGDLNSASTYDYPELPPLPAYLRPSVPQATVGACNVYFPGRYPDALTLGAGEHFFPSGVYYFENPVTLAPGARVVAGEGRWSGCTFDAEAAFAPTAPSFHAITGKGATFVLGGNASIDSNNASLRINRRVSDSTSRGTETVAIRSVNFGAAPTAPAPVEIPDDIVYLADAYDPANSACNATLSTFTCLQRAADHSVQPTASAPTATYTASTLTPSDTIISIDQSSGTASSNQFVTDGYVFVPNSKISFSGGTNADYRLRVSAGIVASSAEFAYGVLPSNASNWFVGVLDEPIQRQLELFARVTAPNGQRTESRAIMEVNIDESYAINGWTVDPNVQGPTPTVTTTTAPPVTTTTEPTPTTTVPGPTTTTTVPGPTPTVDAPCNVSVGDWTRNFGDGTWSAEYRNLPSFSGLPPDPFGGTPTEVADVGEVFKADDGGAPGTLITVDHFSARFTRTIEVGTTCTVDVRMGGDDGMRLFHTDPAGTTSTVMADWSTHSYLTEEAELTLQPGTNTLVFEFFERGGSAGYELEWRS